MGMRWITFVLIGVGVLAVVGLILSHDGAAVLSLVTDVGWGLVLVVAARIVPVVTAAGAWRTLLRAQGWQASWARVSALRWLADSINALLPVAQVGGEVVRGQWMVRHGLPGSDVAAGILVDMTATLAALIGFVGLSLAVGLVGLGDAVPLAQFAIAIGVLAGMMAGMVAAQRSGLFTRLAGRLKGVAGGDSLSGLAGGAGRLDQALAALYADRAALTKCTLWRFLAWLAGAAEIWLIVWLIHGPIGLLSLLVLEGVAQAIRNAGFFMPAGLGVQEGGYVLGGLAIGLPVETALALALVKRARDVLVGVPSLIAWQIAEARYLARAEPTRENA